MPQYEYFCKKCDEVIVVEKKMSQPNPRKCPQCRTKGLERYFGSAPSVTYKGRPPWTYKECLKGYKDCRLDGGPRTKIDPRKHGDIGAWHSPGEVVPPSKSDIAADRKKRAARG